MKSKYVASQSLVDFFRPSSMSSHDLLSANVTCGDWAIQATEQRSHG